MDEVDFIVCEKKFREGKRRRTKYLIKWKDCDYSMCTWTETVSKDVVKKWKTTIESERKRRQNAFEKDGSV